jgi:hypothetical protein
VTQFLALLAAGLGTAALLDKWAGHDTPILFGLAVFGSFISYIYSAPPLKLKQSGWAGNYALGSSYIALPWWAGQVRGAWRRLGGAGGAGGSGEEEEGTRRDAAGARPSQALRGLPCAARAAHRAAAAAPSRPAARPPPPKKTEPAPPRNTQSHLPRPRPRPSRRCLAR